MTIEAGVAVASPDRPTTDIQEALEEYREFGHCVVHDAFSNEEIAGLKQAVLSIRAAGWPLIFAFVYDAFWAMTRRPKFDSFVGALAGPGYQPAVSFWINHVPARRGGSGFPPHLDDVRPGHASVTCWVPLTAATPDNGCVYVIERGAGDGDVARPITDGRQVTTAQVTRALANVRALPAMPGSFLAWPQDTIHWGGRYHRGVDDRMAISWHLTAGDFENVDAGLRLALRPELPLPPLADRLRWIAHSLLRFRGREAILERFAPVAQLLIDQDPPAVALPQANEMGSMR
jgi:ectoine hydroxylase-related dioxygenase (phytanoyl-CoA dioxygenase family)